MHAVFHSTLQAGFSSTVSTVFRYLLVLVACSPVLSILLYLELLAAVFSRIFLIGHALLLEMCVLSMLETVLLHTHGLFEKAMAGLIACSYHLVFL